MNMTLSEWVLIGGYSLLSLIAAGLATIFICCITEGIGRKDSDGRPEDYKER